jgi:hypothetical protein
MKEKNFLVKAFDYFIDTITELFVSLFDGLLRGVDHATPSTFALDATLLPWALPLPIAFMTAHSLEAYFSWDHWAAITMGLGLEGLGILVWARLANAIVERRVSRGAMWMLAGVAFVYEALLVTLNVVLSIRHGTDGYYALVLFLVCLLPMLSAVLFGFHKYDVINKLAAEKAEAAALAEKIRQERREDRRAAQELKVKYAKDAPAVKLDGDKPFRGKRS